jgi:hypothetical protein
MGTGSEGIAASRCDGENDELGSREAHNVTSSPQEDCGVSESEMGEGEGATEKSRLDRTAI